MPEQKFYSIRQRPSAAGEKSAEVLIYGDIGESWYGESVTAKEFVRELAALDVEELTIRVNSYGGSVPEGIAIHNAIKRHKAKTTIAIDGIAASIASLIAMAGDTVEMAENALLMVHAPWGFAMGNSKEMREYADHLDTWSKAMATSYAAKTGMSEDEVMALLTDGVDHFYTAEEAKDAGFVDSVTASLALAAHIDRAAVAARFKTMPATAGKTPAAAAAQPAHKETMMPEQNKPAADPQAATNEAEIRAAAVKQEADRRAAIKALATGNIIAFDGMQEVIAACENDINCSVEDARAKVLAHMSKGTEPLAGGHVVTTEDEADKARRGVSSALRIRAGLEKNDGANPYRGYTLFELARASAERAGVKTGHLDKMGVVAAAFTHSTSDFTNLLADVANKAMLKGYEEAEETFQRWTSVGNLPDFKAAKRVGLDTFPTLSAVPEGAEYSYATVGDRGETIQLATYGKLFSITRQAIINDDLDAFTKLPRSMGRAAIRTVGNLVYAVLTGNPKMSDNVDLFHATHNNLLSSAAITTDSVDKMMAAMAKQKDGTGSTLNIGLSYLLVPVALRGAASVVANSEYEVGASSKNNTVPNSVRGLFEVIADARLDAASSSHWYGAANPAMFDTIEVAYLDGNQTPVLEQQAGWDIDGVEFKVRIDAGVKPLDFRTLAKNPWTGS